MENKGKSRIGLITIFVFLFVVAIVTGIGVSLYSIPQGTITPGVSILNTSVGELTQEQALVRVAKVSQKSLEEPVILTYKEKEYQISPQDINATVESKAIIEEALSLGRQGSFWNKIKERRWISKKGINLTPKVQYDHKKLSEILEGIAEKTDSESENARLIFDGIDFKTVGEKMGEKVNVKQAITDIEKRFLNSTERKVELTSLIITPDTLEADLKQLHIKEIISEFSTNFDATNENRTHNIKIAAEAINGYIVFPGDVFSFNDIVGHRSKERDYKESLVIIDSEFVPGTGGGVCQVSSTLYNVVLLSNMKIVERYNHSRPVTYLPLGRDATVLDDRLDLKFQNTHSFPIMINTEVKGGRLDIKFFGEKKLEEEIRISTSDQEETPPETKQKEEPGLQKGDQMLEEGKPGYKIIVWREIIKNGQVLKKEKISKDTYKPVSATLYQGTGTAPIFEEIFPFE